MTSTAMIRPAWTPVTIGLMVLGFIIFWPLGLAMLAYILWGDRLHAQFGIPYPQQGKKSHKSRHRHWQPQRQRQDTGNFAFDDYRKAEIERLEAERSKLEEERAEFEEFLTVLRRAKDQEEFDRFMNDRAAQKPQSGAKNKSGRDDGTIEL